MTILFIYCIIDLGGFMKWYEKRYRKYIKEYLEILNSDLFEQFWKENEKSIPNLWHVNFLDVLNNKELNKLRNIINSHPIRNFKFSHLKSFKMYPTTKLTRKDVFNPKSRKISFNRLPMLYVGNGRFAEINPNDGFIKEISISYSQIDSQNFILQYDIWFNKAFISLEEYRKFLNKYMKLTFNKSYKCNSWFNEDIEKNKCENVLKNIDKHTVVCLQAFIDEYLYTNYGSKYNLPVFKYFDCENTEYKPKDLKKAFLCNCYVADKQTYIIENHSEYENIYDIYFYGKNIPQFDFGYFIAHLKVGGYYYFFDEIEKLEINNRLGKYFSFNKRIKEKDYKWLASKLHVLKSQNYTIDDHKMLKWQCYYDGKKVENGFKKYIEIKDKYEKIYNDYNEYISSLINIQKDRTTFILSVVALLVSFVSLLIAFI